MLKRRKKKKKRKDKRKKNHLCKLIIVAALSQKNSQSCLQINNNRCLGKKSNSRANIQYDLIVFHNIQLTDY